jgi:hypothetical protein
LPAENAHNHQVNQDPPGFDLARFAHIVALVGSDKDGEALNAGRIADRLLKAAGMQWADFITAYRRAEIATEAAAQLLSENEQLRAENDRLRTTSTAVALWHDIGAQVSDTRKAAAWALALHQQGKVWLSPDCEVQFLRTCMAWSGRLTPKMQSSFQQIMDRIVTRTGLTPPP